VESFWRRIGQQMLASELLFVGESEEDRGGLCARYLRYEKFK
jgi:hypothetical protein